MLNVMQLEIMFPKAGLIAVQVFLKAGVSVVVGLPKRVGNFGIPAFFMPAVTVIVLICTHILLEAFIPVFFRSITVIGGNQLVVRDVLLQNIIVAQHIRSGGVDRIQGEIGVDMDGIQLAHHVYTHLVIDVDNKPLNDYQLLTVFAKQHIVRKCAGDRCDYRCISDIKNHLWQRELFRGKNSITVFGEKIIHGIQAEFVFGMCGKLAAGEVDLVQGIPGRVRTHIVRNDIK